MVKNPPAKKEIWVWSTEWEDALEKEMVTPLQYSCLRNALDRGDWKATVHGTEESDIT